MNLPDLPSRSDVDARSWFFVVDVRDDTGETTDGDGEEVEGFGDTVAVAAVDACRHVLRLMVGNTEPESPMRAYGAIFAAVDGVDVAVLAFSPDDDDGLRTSWTMLL